MAAQTEAPNPAVDELKRRARRRLVGAVVLALAAAVILPLLLESDPKPVGEDVSIQIPPIDNGKFITPLSPDNAAPPKSGEHKNDAKGPPGANEVQQGPTSAIVRRDPAEAEQRMLGRGGVVTTRPLRVDAPGETKSNPGADPVTSAAPSHPAAAPGAVADASGAVSDKTSGAEVRAAAQASPPSTSAPKPGVSGPYQIQLAAFGDAKAAAELARKVKASGFAVHTEDVPTRQGTVQRVRVGPFTTRAAADSAAGKLKALGYSNAQVVAAK